MSTQTPDLRTAAQAVIDRWETPLWKDAPATAGYIAALRDALAAEQAENETLRMGYAAARLEIESLQARIKTVAEERSDELTVAHLDGRMRAAQPVTAQQPGATYSSTQATNCACCGERKHTPLRIDAMGGYVCLTCINKKLSSLLGEFGYEKSPAQAAPAYKDSTPELHVGDSAFESWYSNYSPAHKGDKQRARDAYAAGMGDPLVTAAPQQEAQEPVMIYHGDCIIDCGEHGHHHVELLRMIPAGSKLYTAPQPTQAQAGAPESAEFDQFLSDVLTAAGLVTQGKQCKALGERLADMCMKLRLHGIKGGQHGD